MRQNDQMLMRRWDGQARVAAIYDPLREDPDLLDPDGDCLVYLSVPSFYREKHSFVVSMDKLISSKCLPLFQGLNTIEADQSEQKQRPSRWKKHSYTLCLEASEELSSKEVQLYHATTRNFFAWLMSKPLIGPDPASALLALKLRMDLWRAPTVDNLSDIYKYAKSQGYGDLSDVSLLLTSHLDGAMFSPEGYRMVDEAGYDDLTTDSTNQVLKTSIRNRLQSLQLRFTSFKSINMSDGPTKDSFASHKRSYSDVTLMSGAVAPGSKIPKSFAKLPETGVASCYDTDSDDGNDTPAMAKMVNKTFSRRRPGPNRTYSLPVLPHGSIEDVSRQLEKRSSWVELLTRDHTDQIQKETESLSPLANTSGVEMTPITASSLSLSTLARPRASMHRRRTSLQLSRAPSPIQEEGTEHIPPLPAKNPRRYSLDEVNLGRGWLPAITPQSSWAADTKSLIDNTSITSSQRSLTSATASDTSIRCSEQPPLPSQAIMNCKGCGKPKPPEIVRRKLLGRSSMEQSAIQTRTSFESGLSTGNPALRRPSTDTTTSAAVAFAPETSEHVPTRFPSLRRLKSSMVLPAHKGIDAPPFSYHSRVTYPFQHNNTSEPNLRSSLTTNSMRERRRVTIEIPRSNNFVDPADADDEFVKRTAPQPPSSKGDITRIGSSLKRGASRKHTSHSDVGLQGQDYRTENEQKGEQALFSDRPNSVVVLDNLESPIGSGNPHDSTISLMDSMLDEISNRHSLISNTHDYELPPDVKETGPPKLYVSIVTPAGQTKEGLTAKASVRNKLRNSLRRWNDRKKSVNHSPPQIYQGNMLILDASGNFSTTALPVGDYKADWEKDESTHGRNTHVKKLYEMP